MKMVILGGCYGVAYVYKLKLFLCVLGNFTEGAGVFV
jgi:hypothetical protein